MSKEWRVELNREEWKEKIGSHNVYSIEEYINKRTPPSHFLRAVLENNLKEAFGQADMSNRARLFDLTSFMYCEVPTACWGTKERVALWLGETTPEEIVSQTIRGWIEDEDKRNELLAILRKKEESV